MLTSHIGNLLSHELRSITENREKALLFCKNKLFEIQSKWENDLLKSEIDTQHIQENCGEEKPFFIHTHILHPSDPSDEDFEGYDKRVFQGFCVAGIDGTRCYDNNKERIFKQRWNSEFSNQFLDIGGLKWKGRNLFCDHIGNKYYCELNTENRIVKMGIFNKLTIKGGKIAFKAGDSDITHQSIKGKHINCFSTKNGNELSCIVTK